MKIYRLINLAKNESPTIDNIELIVDEVVIPPAEKLSVFNAKTSVMYTDVDTLDIDGLDIDFSNPDQGRIKLTTETKVSDVQKNTLSRLSDGLYNAPFLGDGIISGGDITWSGQGYIYNFNPIVYRWNGFIKELPSGFFSINSGSSDPRIDSIVIQNDQVIVYQGVPSPNPVSPTVDTFTALKIADIFVPAFSTTPVIQTEVLFDENVEWTPSSTGAVTLFIYNDPPSAVRGNYSLGFPLFPSSPSDSFLLTRGSPIGISPYKTLSFYINFTVAPSGDLKRKGISLRFRDGADNPIGNRVVIKNNSYGLNFQTLGYQKVTIPLSDFGLTTEYVKSLRFSNVSQGASSTLYFRLDYIKLELIQDLEPQNQFKTVFKNGLTESQGIVKLGGVFTDSQTIVGNIGPNFQSNTTYDTDIANRYYTDSLEKSILHSLSTPGVSSTDGIKSYGGNVIYDIPSGYSGESYVQFYGNNGSNNASLLSTVQFGVNKTDSNKNLLVRNNGISGTDSFESKWLLNNTIISDRSTLNAQNSTASVSAQFFEENYIDINKDLDQVNSVDSYREVSFLNSYCRSELYADNGSAFIDINSGSSDNGGYLRFFSPQGTSTLTRLRSYANVVAMTPNAVELKLEAKNDDTRSFIFRQEGGGKQFEISIPDIQNPTIYALTNPINMYLPLSVNGNYADASGNITVATGGGGTSWELLGNSGTNPAINFLGTTDNQDVVIRRNNTQIARFYLNEVSIGRDTGKRSTSIFIGFSAGNGITEFSGASEAIFIGYSVGLNATDATSSIFLGAGAGNNATTASYSNFIGQSAGSGATNAYRSNFFGWGSGQNASSAMFSNFLGQNAGRNATNANDSNFIGATAGENATNASFSNFIGTQAGGGATNASYSNLIGNFAGYTFAGNNIGSNNIIIGNRISLPNGTSNAINIGGILFGTGTYSVTSGNPSITAVVGGRIGIRTVTPQNTLHITSETANTSGLRFTNLTSASPTSTGQAIGVDANGDVVTIVSGGGGGLTTADNGLTANTSTNVRLGGTLVQDTTITTSTNTFTVTGQPSLNGAAVTTITTTKSGGNPLALYVSSTNLGTCITVDANSVNGTTGILGQNFANQTFSVGASNGIFLGTSTTDTGPTPLNITRTTATAPFIGLPAAQITRTHPSNDVINGLTLTRTSNAGPGGNGIGVSISFELEDASSNILSNSGQIAYSFTNATNGALRSEFTFNAGHNSGSVTVLKMQSTGIFILSQGLSDFVDDAAAATGGIPVNGLYRTGSTVKIRVS